MRIATILTPPSIAPAEAVFCIMSEPYIPEGPEYENYMSVLSLSVS